MERIEELQRGGESITGVASGFKDLDELTAGFQPSDLIIVAGRPSMGKTAFVLNIAQNAALDHNVPVAFFSLEMSKEQLVQRLLTSEGRVDAQRLRKGKLHDDEFVRLGRAAGILSHAPIWIDDTPGMTLLEMRSKARRLKIENNIGMVVIDYLQLMQGPTNTESRQQEISYISRSLKALARELRVPVVALSQLSRAPEQRTGENKRPQLSDLRESGAIEQDADLVMFIYRQEMYDGPTDKDGNSLEGRAEIIVGKQRNGPTGLVNLYFNKTYTRFENLLAPPNAAVSPKARSVYRCTNCGADHPRWAGRCDVCGEWNSLVEEMATSRASATASGRRVARSEDRWPKEAASLRLRAFAISRAQRVADRVEDGNQGIRFRPRRRNRAGIDGPRRWRARNRKIDAAAPGRWQTSRSSATRTLYVSGEESALQVKLRAERLHGSAEDVALLDETLLETILATARLAAARCDRRGFDPDGIHQRSRRRAGNVGQVRECAARLMRFAKETGTTVFAVGHVTQGWRNRRTEDARAHRRHRALLRGRGNARAPHPSGDQEPIRQRRRDRRLPNDRGRARSRSRILRSCSSVTGSTIRREAPSPRSSRDPVRC